MTSDPGRQLRAASGRTQRPVDGWRISRPGADAQGMTVKNVVSVWAPMWRAAREDRRAGCVMGKDCQRVIKPGVLN